MSTLQTLLPVIVFLPFALALLALLLGRFAGAKTGLLMVLSAGTSLALTLKLIVAGGAHEPVVFSVPWIADLNITLSLRGDGFGLFFAALVSGIGVLVGIYSLGYIAPMAGNRFGRYYAALIAFMGSMLGVALADDLMLMFVFWEITSITSFILIGFWYEEDYARKGAMTALLVTALGGLAMMVGFIVVGNITETFRISELASDPGKQALLMSSPLLVPAMLLVLAGAFTKSAQFPFHFWLPGAMVAPTPVSTYLHAATMVKAGIFLVGRMMPVFGDVPSWSAILTVVGLVTFALGAYQSFQETDLKAILARTTFSTLGLVMLIYGIKTPNQDTLQIFSHGAYKGSLFLMAGMVEHAAHTRDLRKLGGLFSAMPKTFLVCLLGALSMAGLPPFFGFLAKEVFYTSLLHNAYLEHWPVLHVLVIAVAVLSNAFIFAVAFKLIIGVFFGPRPAALAHAHEASPTLWLPAMVLAGLALGMGVLGGTHLTSDVVNDLSSNHHEHLHVSLLPSHMGPVLLTLATITLGAGLYFRRAAVERAQWAIAKALPTAQGVWDGLLAGVTRAAETFSRNWQSGSLRWYVSGILCFLFLATMFALGKAQLGLHRVHVNMVEMPWYGLALCALLAIAVWTMVTSRTRLGASLALTATGFLVSLLFVLYRSPDILLTQILIETVSTIFILLVLFFMPPFKREPVQPARKAVNVAVSVAVGAMMALLVLLCMSPEFQPGSKIGGDYLAKCLAEGGGRNAVNVIIVDMRAIDTTGEITVLVVVGMLVFGLLRSRRRKSS